MGIKYYKVILSLIYQKRKTMTISNLNQLVSEGKKMTIEQKLSDIKLSNYSTIQGFHNVIVKRDNAFVTIHAFHLNMFENIYTLDERLIANRIG